jgi:hypothetical protein
MLAVGVVAASPGLAATARRALARTRTAVAGVAPRPAFADGGHSVARPVDRDRATRALATAVAAVALALAAYAIGYLALVG